MVSTTAFTLLLVAGLSAAEVFSGTPASIEDYPSIVQVEKGVGPAWVQACVGTILTSRHVLSAAQCFLIANFAPRYTRVRAGTSERGRGGEVFRVDTVYNHPSYHVLDLDGNISILRLATAMTFGSTMQQAAIASPGVNFPAYVPVTLASWGRTSQDAIWANRDLHSVQLYTVDHSTCVDKYASLLVPIPVSDNMMCTSIPGEDGNNIGIRDSGSPIFYDGVLVGVEVIGSPYGDSYPMLATAVSAYSDWIIATAV